MDRIVGLIVLAALIYVIYILQSRARVTRPLGATPFRRKDYMLTRSERAFYEVLCRGVDQETRVFPKVRLADLVWLPQGTPNRQGLLNRVVSKHVDFVLCTGAALTPLLAVELDDSSHDREQRQVRDETVDSILNSADLPLLRVRVKQSYSAEELKDMIRLKLGLPARNERPLIEVRKMDGSDDLST